MSDQIKQQISELVDGELAAVERDALLSQLKQSNEHKDKWQRYFLISDAIKKNLHANPKNDLYSRVKAAIDLEPAILIPTINDKTVKEIPSEDVRSFPPNPRENITKPSRFPAMGLALAASVAAVAIFGLQLGSSPGLLEQEGSMATAEIITAAPALQVALPDVQRNVQNVSVSGNLQSESVLAEQANPFAVGEWKRIDSTDLPLMSPYFAEHNEFSASPNVQPGTVPYARVVSFGDKEAQ